MIYGRLGPFNRWTWCALAFVCGLIFTQCAHAVVVENMAAANALCESRAAAYRSRESESTTYEAKCVHVPLEPSSGRHGGIYCLSLNWSKSNERESGGFGFCRSSGSDNSLAIGSSAPGRYDSEDFNAPPLYSTIYTTSYAHFAWLEETEEKDCSEESEFDSRDMSADTPNGTGTVCYQECQYSVSMWYNGTYPAGYLEYTFSPNGLNCNGNEDPTTDPPDLDDEPLDLDPDDGGVDPGPDPGDGDSASSGGGTCDAAPQCTGDSLQCNILFQTWATRCAVEGEGEGDGDGLGEALEGVADGLGEVGDQIGELGDQLGSRSGEIFGDGEDVSGSIPGLGALNTGDKVFDSETLDQSGFGMPRSCPAILTDSISFGFFGNQYDISFDLMCDLLELVGQILVVLSAFVGVRILLRSVQ